MTAQELRGIHARYFAEDTSVRSGNPRTVEYRSNKLRRNGRVVWSKGTFYGNVKKDLN